jgi:hypothetical protein
MKKKRKGSNVPTPKTQLFKPKAAISGRPVRAVSLIDQEDRRAARHMLDITRSGRD